MLSYMRLFIVEKQQQPVSYWRDYGSNDLNESVPVPESFNIANSRYAKVVHRSVHF